MTSIRQRVSNVLAIREPNQNLPAIGDQMETDMAQFLPRYNDPEVTASDVTGAIDRHNAVSTAELRKLKETLQSRHDVAIRLIDDLITMVDTKMAEAAAIVRGETDWVNRKIQALESE